MPILAETVLGRGETSDPSPPTSTLPTPLSSSGIPTSFRVVTPPRLPPSKCNRHKAENFSSRELGKQFSLYWDPTGSPGLARSGVVRTVRGRVTSQTRGVGGGFVCKHGTEVTDSLSVPPTSSRGTGSLGVLGERPSEIPRFRPLGKRLSNLVERSESGLRCHSPVHDRSRSSL